MNTDLAPALAQGLAELQLPLDSATQAQLLRYLALLHKWNRTYNLTAVREPADMLGQHLLDSLATVPALRRQLQTQKERAGENAWRLLDVGSGGGLPGVVLAICCPDLQVTCVDAVAKKAAFIQQAAAELGLTPRLRGLHARVESLQGPFDIITSRAFASLADFSAWSAQALAPGGVWMAMKGRHPQEEIAALPPSVQVFHVEPLQVPGLDAERCLVWMRPSADTSQNLG